MMVQKDYFCDPYASTLVITYVSEYINENFRETSEVMLILDVWQCTPNSIHVLLFVAPRPGSHE